MESIRSATGLRGFRRVAWDSRLERSRDIHGNPTVDILERAAETAARGQSI